MAAVEAADLGRHDPRLDALLADLGYTWLDYVQARFWLRRGKPDGYRWDD